MNNDKRVTNLLVIIPAAVAIFLFGFYFGGASAKGGTAATTDYTLVTDGQFEPFWKAWSVLRDKSILEASTTPESKVWGAIQGLAASYNDPYTAFFPPTQSKIFSENIAGDFGGVGMEIGVKANQLVVVAPLKDTPASRAGVKAGDAILAINGTSTIGMPVDRAVGYIRGPVGSSVKIVFLSKGADEPVERTLSRAIIHIPTIDTLEKPGNVYVIRLYSFTAQSPELFRDALRRFYLTGYKKLVIDLRGNPGGYLEAARDMASYFLPAGEMVVVEDFGRPGQEIVFRSKGYQAFGPDLKIAILVDAGSASAAEILAGALQDNGRAKLVGMKTFGKGSVQELVPITSDTSLKVTVANWLTPKGRNLSKDGLEPDYKVDYTEADRKADRDPQMDKALQVLNDLP